MSEVKEIPIEKIQVGEHAQRLDISDESLDGLTSSIGRLGLVYPLIVRKQSDGYILVEGHRRLAACKRLGLKEANCSVQEAGQDNAAETAFAGNFFRKDLSSVELASAIKDVHDSGKMSLQELQRGFNKSFHWIQRMLAICDWPTDVLEALHNEAISVAAAANLACVTDDNYRTFLVRNAIEQGATARTTAAWLQAWRAMQPAEEAITSEPVTGRPTPQPTVPQAPCFCCSQIFAVNEMSHVPVCGGCVQILRQSVVPPA